MKLRDKLTYRSVLFSFITLSFIIAGTYFLFRYSTAAAYRNKLSGIATLSAHFYLEKDEDSEQKHRKVEREFKKISKESVKLYRLETGRIYIEDSLDFKISETTLAAAKKNGIAYYKKDSRQFVYLLYNDNQGDFIIVVSGVDVTGAKQCMTLIEMLLFFGLLGLSLQFIIISIVANKTFKPFNELVKQARSIKGDDWQARLNYPNATSENEIHDLVVEFNYLLDRNEESYLVQRNFLRHISHEIKTPLAVIIGDVEVALNSPKSNEEYIALLHSLKVQGIHLKDLVESLLNLSNIEASQHRHTEELRIDEVVWDILERKKIVYPNHKAKVNFIDAAEINEDRLTMKANRSLLFIAISNIIDNAFKFSDKDIEIAFATQNQQLILTIKDNGSGIATAEQLLIFNLFYRIAQTQNIPGHGIGLYLTKQILDTHNIQIQIASEPGHFTEFTLTFPT